MDSTSEYYWTAFYTKPRSEKKAAMRLEQKGFEIYCPTRTVVKQWSDRKKKIKEPVFTSYLFARVNEAQRQKVLYDPAVVCSVFWLKKPVKIRQEEIDSIREFLDEFPSACSASENFREGDSAQITAGPLNGESGVIKEIRGSKVLLQLKSLGLSLQAEVSANTLILEGASI